MLSVCTDNVPMVGKLITLVNEVPGIPNIYPLIVVEEIGRPLDLR
jgi:hypothetical protein